MATIKAVIHKNDQRSDGLWRVAYRLYHNKILFIETSHYISKREIGKDGEIKEAFVTSYLSEELKRYRDSISSIGNRISLMTCEQLRSYLVGMDDPLDFVWFSREYIDKEVTTKRVSAYTSYGAVVSNIVDFHRNEVISPLEITEYWVSRFELYLSSEKELENSSINTYIVLFKKLFKEMKKKYNNEAISDIKIPHDPFKSRKPLRKKKTRDRELSIEDIKRIRVIDPSIGKTSKGIGRDCFMFVFLMLGVNLKDIYDNILSITPETKRFEYNRSKTSDRRDDEAFISVNIPNEAREYIERIQEFLISKKYTRYNSFYCTVLNQMRSIGDSLGIDKLGSYHARISFSNISVNTLGVDPYHVSLALNHIEGVFSSTRPYIKPNWKFIDDVQEKVISHLYEKDVKVKSLVNIFSNINLYSLNS